MAAPARQKMIQKRGLLLLLWVLSFSVGACTSPTALMSKSAASLHNPLVSVADPFIVYHQGSYYLTGTRTTRSLEIWYSPHLETVSKTSKTIWTPGPGEPAFQVWSPSMFLLTYHGASHWFVYFTAAAVDKNEAHRIYVLQSEGADPLGPYT
ncbi:MAG TPA: family 43 glycosylhydrolase, partial [Ktedonobacteraceae bacterium]